MVRQEELQGIKNYDLKNATKNVQRYNVEDEMQEEWGSLYVTSAHH